MDEVHDVLLISELLSEKFCSIFHNPRNNNENGYKKVQKLSTGNRVFGKKVKTRRFNGREVKVLDIKEVFTSKLKLHDYIPEVVIPEENRDSYEFTSVDFVADTNKTPMLHLECAKGDLSMARMLIDNGAKVNSQQENGNTALMEAVFRITDDHLEVARLLLAAGADVNIQNKSGFSAFTVATSTGNVMALRLMKEWKGDNVNEEVTTKKGMTALIIAASRANRVMMKYLIEECDANIMAATNDGKWTAYNLVTTYTTDYCMKFLGQKLAAENKVKTYVRKRISALKRNTLDPQLMLTEMVSLPPLFLLESSLMPSDLRRNAIGVLMTLSDDNLDDHDEQCYLLHRLIPWFLMLTALRCYIRPLVPQTQREVVLDFFALNADELLLQCVRIYKDDDLMMFNFTRMISFLCSEEEGKKWVQTHGADFQRCTKVTHYDGRFLGRMQPPFHPKFNVPCVQLIRCETADDKGGRAKNIDIVKDCIGRCVADINMKELIEEEEADKRKREKKRERKKRRQQQRREEAKEKLEASGFESSEESDNESDKETKPSAVITSLTTKNIIDESDFFSVPDTSNENDVDYGIFSIPPDSNEEVGPPNTTIEMKAKVVEDKAMNNAEDTTIAGPYWGFVNTSPLPVDDSFSTVTKKSVKPKTVYNASWSTRVSPAKSPARNNGSPRKGLTNSPARRRIPLGMSYKKYDKQQNKLMKKAETNNRNQASKDKCVWPAKNTHVESSGTYIPTPIDKPVDKSPAKSTGSPTPKKPVETYQDFFDRMVRNSNCVGDEAAFQNARAFMKARGLETTDMPLQLTRNTYYGIDCAEFPKLPLKKMEARYQPSPITNTDKPSTLKDLSEEFAKLASKTIDPIFQPSSIETEADKPCTLEDLSEEFARMMLDDSPQIEKNWMCQPTQEQQIWPATANLRPDPFAEPKEKYVTKCNDMVKSVTKCGDLEKLVTKCSNLQKSVAKCQELTTSVTKCSDLEPSVTKCRELAKSVTKCSELEQKWDDSDWSLLLTKIGGLGATTDNIHKTADVTQQQAEVRRHCQRLESLVLPSHTQGATRQESTPHEPWSMPEWVAKAIDERVQVAFRKYNKESTNVLQTLDTAAMAALSSNLNNDDRNNHEKASDHREIGRSTVDGVRETDPTLPAERIEIADTPFAKDENDGALQIVTNDPTVSECSTEGGTVSSTPCTEQETRSRTDEDLTPQARTLRKHHSDIEMPLVEDKDTLKDWVCESHSQPNIVKLDDKTGLRNSDAGDLTRKANEDRNMFKNMVFNNTTNKSYSDILDNNQALINGASRKNKPREQGLKATQHEYDLRRFQTHSTTHMQVPNVVQQVYQVKVNNKQSKRFIIHLTGSETSDSDTDSSEDIYTDNRPTPCPTDFVIEQRHGKSEEEFYHEVPPSNNFEDDKCMGNRLALTVDNIASLAFTDDVAMGSGAQATLSLRKDKSDEGQTPQKLDPAPLSNKPLLLDLNRNLNVPESTINKSPKVFDIESVLTQTKPVAQGGSFFPSMPTGSVFAHDLEIESLLNSTQGDPRPSGVEQNMRNAIIALDLEANLRASASGSDERNIDLEEMCRSEAAKNLCVNAPVSVSSDSRNGTVSSGSSGTSQNEEPIPKEDQVPCLFGLQDVKKDDSKCSSHAAKLELDAVFTESVSPLKGNSGVVPASFTTLASYSFPSQPDDTGVGDTNHAVPVLNSSPQGRGPISPWIPRSLVWHDKLQMLNFMDKKSKLRLGLMFTSSDESSMLYGHRNGVAILVGLSCDGYEAALKRVQRVKYRGLESWLTKVKRLQLDNRFLAKYFECVEDVHSGYLTMELCDYNLTQYMRMLTSAGRLNTQALIICYQILAGLQALHDVAMLHMNLKPTNVLIDANGRVKLSDFGLFYGSPRSPTQTMRSILSVCWSPTEVLNPKYQGLPYTSASDVQVAGMLIHYVLTGGLHPFGEDPHQCQHNIKAGSPRFGACLGFMAQHLLSWMLPPDVPKRKSISECLLHPLFWPESRRFAFILAVAEQQEILDRKLTSITKEINSYSNWIGCSDWQLAVAAPEAFGFHGLRKGYSSSVCDLLRCIADFAKQFRKMPVEFQTNLVNPRFYFDGLYPKLFLPIFDIVYKTDWKDRPALSSFFTRKRT